MVNTLDASELRRWAMRCFDEAHDPAGDPTSRKRLLKMHEALLVLADSADWLAGRNRPLTCERGDLPRPSA